MYTKTIITQDRRRTWRVHDYIIDHPDMAFSGAVNETSSNMESFNEDDMYGLDYFMMVMSDSLDNGEEMEVHDLSDDGEKVDVSDLSHDREEVESLGPNENVSNIICVILIIV
jgi:hypothetical protein